MARHRSQEVTVKEITWISLRQWGQMCDSSILSTTKAAGRQLAAGGIREKEHGQEQAGASRSKRLINHSRHRWRLAIAASDWLLSSGHIDVLGREGRRTRGYLKQTNIWKCCMDTDPIKKISACLYSFPAMGALYVVVLFCFASLVCLYWYLDIHLIPAAMVSTRANLELLFWHRFDASCSFWLGLFSSCQSLQGCRRDAAVICTVTQQH